MWRGGEFVILEHSPVILERSDRIQSLAPFPWLSVPSVVPAPVILERECWL